MSPICTSFEIGRETAPICKSFENERDSICGEARGQIVEVDAVGLAVAAGPGASHAVDRGRAAAVVSGAGGVGDVARRGAAEAPAALSARLVALCVGERLQIDNRIFSLLKC